MVMKGLLNAAILAHNHFLIERAKSVSLGVEGATSL